MNRQWSWPFFDESHRSLAGDIRRWARDSVPGLVDGDPYASTRRLVTELGRAGWLRYVVPASAGGVNDRIDARSLCVIRETLAAESGLADFAFAMQGLGSGPISLAAGEDLARGFLADVVSGKAVAAFALSESEAGSDVAATKTAARRDGDAYVIDGAKTWTSNAGLADFYVVFARTGEAPGARGLSAFVVPADSPGLSVSERIEVTAPHPLGSLQFERCRIPARNRIGEGGKGFHVAMATLDLFRPTVGAAALGFARRALGEAVAHARERELFGQKLADFQMTQQKIADMATAVDASALLVYRAAWQKDGGAERITREAAMAKLFATEAAQRVIDDALQLLGGRGVVRDSILESLYRDIRPLRIYEGTTEIQKLVIARDVLARSEEGDA